MTSTEDKYREIGKAVINECLARGDARFSSITLRTVQFNGKLYIRMEEVVEPISIWKFRDLAVIAQANRKQRARECGNVLTIRVRRAELQMGLPREMEVE